MASREDLTQRFQESRQKFFNNIKKNGSPAEIFELGKNYYNCGDYANAYSCFSKSAKRGETKSLFWLGECFYYGRGVARDIIAAFEAYFDSAMHGDSNSQERLGGQIFVDGVCVVEDCNRDAALLLFLKGEPYDEKVKNIDYIRMYAENGNKIAQYKMGHYFANVSHDMVKAFEWYVMSAQQGDSNAQYNVGLCYYYGNGVAQSYSTACEWFERAANQGHVESKYRLGYCYFNNLGVRSDIDYGIKLVKEADALGSMDAHRYLSMVKLRYKYNKSSFNPLKSGGHSPVDKKVNVAGTEANDLPSSTLWLMFGEYVVFIVAIGLLCDWSWWAYALCVIPTILFADSTGVLISIINSILWAILFWLFPFGNWIIALVVLIISFVVRFKYILK